MRNDGCVDGYIEEHESTEHEKDFEEKHERSGTGTSRNARAPGSVTPTPMKRHRGPKTFRRTRRAADTRLWWWVSVGKHQGSWKEEQAPAQERHWDMLNDKEAAELWEEGMIVREIRGFRSAELVLGERL